MAMDGEVAGEEFLRKKKQKDSASKEEENRKKKITPGSLMKAIIRPGGGEVKPKDGDLVLIHSTVRTLDGVIIESSRAEYGGKGTPLKILLGKSKMIIGLLEAIPTMLKGELAMVKMKPEIHFGETDCPLQASEDFPKNDDLHFEIELIDFFNAKVITDDLGVLKKTMTEGQGWETPREPYEVKIWISAKTSEGNMLFSYIDGEPFHFTFGKEEVPKGLEMGIGTMTRGEKAIIYVCAPYLIHSRLMPNGDITEVQFEVEILQIIQVRDMLGDGRIIKRRIKDGRGEFPMDCPLHDSILRVHYRGMLIDEDRKVFYDTRIDNDGEPLNFGSGEGLVPEGFEMCVRLMLPGEVALVSCPPDYAYDKFKRPENVPEGARVQWEIELLDFEKRKDWTGLSFDDIMKEAEIIKNTGNRLFKEAKYELAKAKYDQVLRDFNHVNSQDDDEGKIFLNTRNSLYLNVAACYLKTSEYRKSIEACNKVLDGSPAHVKALYRRGMAYMSAGDFDEARSDFEMMTKLDKSSEPDAVSALSKLKQKEREVENKAKNQFKGLFDKKPGEIAEVGADSKADAEIIESDKTETENQTPDVEVSEAEISHETAPVGLFAKYWSMGRNLATYLGVNKCSVL